jgi:anaerobic nitric oxide reductase transcription regulator
LVPAEAQDQPIEPTPKAAARAAQRRSILAALRAVNGNWAQAARQMAMDPSNLHKLARRLGLK